MAIAHRSPSLRCCTSGGSAQPVVLGQPHDDGHPGDQREYAQPIETAFHLLLAVAVDRRTRRRWCRRPTFFCDSGAIVSSSRVAPDRRRGHLPTDEATAAVNNGRNEHEFHTHFLVLSNRLHLQSR